MTQHTQIIRFSTRLVLLAALLPAQWVWAERNLDRTRLVLDRDSYKVLAEERQSAIQAHGELTIGLQQIDQLWADLGQASTQRDRISIYGSLKGAITQQRNRSREWQVQQDKVRRQALETLERSEIESLPEIAPEQLAAFAQAGTDIADRAHQMLPRGEQQATWELVTITDSIRRMEAELVEGSRTSVAGIRKAEDLVKVASRAELDQILGRGWEQLMDSMLVLLHDEIVAEKERELNPLPQDPQESMQLVDTTINTLKTLRVNRQDTNPAANTTDFSSNPRRRTGGS